MGYMLTTALPMLATTAHFSDSDCRQYPIRRTRAIRPRLAMIRCWDRISWSGRTQWAAGCGNDSVIASHPRNRRRPALLIPRPLCKHMCPLPDGIVPAWPLHAYLVENGARLFKAATGVKHGLNV